eukprot:1155540-Pelagomonas_calceolata.AAC.3
MHAQAAHSLSRCGQARKRSLPSAAACQLCLGLHDDGNVGKAARHSTPWNGVTLTSAEHNETHQEVHATPAALSWRGLDHNGPGAQSKHILLWATFYPCCTDHQVDLRTGCKSHGAHRSHGAYKPHLSHGETARRSSGSSCLMQVTRSTRRIQTTQITQNDATRKSGFSSSRAGYTKHTEETGHVDETSHTERLQQGNQSSLDLMQVTLSS